MMSSSSVTDSPEALLGRIVYQVEKVIVGKRDVIEKLLVALLAGGHVLLEDVPGVGKTMLVRALARTIDCGFTRIQCTPDLLPSDLTGVSIYNQRTAEFEFRPGPLLAPIVLADELNRTSPRTQAALLEAMEEKRVTVDQIQKTVAEHFGLKQADLISERRARAVARPRQAAMWLAKQITTRSLPDIGRRFGGRDHTTVLHAVRRIEELKQGDPQLARDLDVLLRKLRS